MADRRRAWAMALFRAAPDAERRRAYGVALDGLAAAHAGQPNFRALLREPSVPKAEKAAILAASLGTEDPVFARFCGLLVEKGRSSLLPAIAAVYRRAGDAAEGVARLEVEAAREPDPAVIERLGRAWAASVGAARAATSLRVRPELIAGFRLRSGSIRIDYSVAGRLERLRRALEGN